MKLTLAILAGVMFLTGCTEGYRYPCQNPENWDQKICQKPICSANGTCPEDLSHYEKQLPAQPVLPQKPASKGDGKC